MVVAVDLYTCYVNREDTVVRVRTPMAIYARR